MAGDASPLPDGGKPLVLALRAREAARAIGISPRLLATLVAEKRIPYARINSVIVFPVAHLARWLSEQASGESGQ